MSYSGDMEGCHACPRTTTNNEQRNMKIGLEFWKQNSQKVSDAKYISDVVFLHLSLLMVVIMMMVGIAGTSQASTMEAASLEGVSRLPAAPQTLPLVRQNHLC